MAVRLISHEEPLPGYRLVERIGRGGFGEVWKVEAPGGLLKAMKFVFGDLDSTDEEGRPAEQELKALHRVKSIRHPYILSLERFDIIDGQLIIVMELADRNLWDRFRECRAQGLAGIPRDELLRYLEEVAEALDLMNDHYQIQHLDIKPQNLFLVFNHVKVADFGLAKLFEGERATVTGGVTPVYAPPETFEGWVSRFSDQYSLAIVYQEMLTDTRPFNGANTKQLLLQHLNAPPDVGPLPESDRAIIERALAKKPDERWPTCAEMVRALRGKTAGSSSKLEMELPALAAETPRPTGGSPTEVPVRASYPASPPPLSPFRGGAPPTAPMRKPVTAPPPFRTPGSPNTGSGAVRTPLPGLVTPALVTPKSGGSGSQGMTVPRQQIFQTARMNTLGIAPPERTGSGVLTPALLIGVGQTGLHVLRTFRRLIRERFGSVEAIPTIRYLYLDTDPETIASATQGADPLAARELIHTPLQRPHHYLQDSVAPNIDAWLPNGFLYRLPKTPMNTGGVRPFGRLAFCDHYRLVAQRIRQEIEQFFQEELLDKTATQTGLGLRTNRPRAYILTGLAGGTGSGMLVDLAFVLKHELRAAGYGKLAPTGILLAPPADKNAPKTAGLSNTYAALSEIYHFAAGKGYQTKFDAKEPPIIDADGPFRRTTILTLPKPSRPKDVEMLHGLAAQGLALELLTPVGQVIDQVDAVVPLTPNAVAPIGHLFGSYRVSWPRAELLVSATRRFSQRVLQRWSDKESAHLREPIQQWLTDQWAKLRLEPREVVARFEKAARDVLREDPLVVFDAAVDTLQSSIQASNGRVDVTAICEVLDSLLRLVGKPDTDLENLGSLEIAVRDSLKEFSKEIEANLSATSVSFIEQPQYRLAGAEEVLNQLVERMLSTVGELEKIRDDLAKSLKDGYSRMFQLLGGLGAGSGLSVVVARRASHTGELLEGLRQYPQKRYQLAILDATLTLYRGLLTNIPEYLREVSFCRNRLTEMSQGLDTHAKTSGGIGPGVLILPDGCATINDLVDQLLSALPPADIVKFDQELQKEITRKFRGLANVCLKPARTTDFLLLLQAQARVFLNERFEEIDPSTAFLKIRGDTPASGKLFREAFEKSAPDSAQLQGRPSVEATILAVPPGPNGETVRRIIGAACEGIEFIPAPLPTDIVVYREFPRIELSMLHQLGPNGREAFETQVAADQRPHARADVPWTSPNE